MHPTCCICATLFFFLVNAQARMTTCISTLFAFYSFFFFFWGRGGLGSAVISSCLLVSFSCLPFVLFCRCWTPLSLALWFLFPSFFCSVLSALKHSRGKCFPCPVGIIWEHSFEMPSDGNLGGFKHACGKSLTKLFTIQLNVVNSSFPTKFKRKVSS